MEYSIGSGFADVKKDVVVLDEEGLSKGSGFLHDFEDIYICKFFYLILHHIYDFVFDANIYVLI